MNISPQPTPMTPTTPTQTPSRRKPRTSSPKITCALCNKRFAKLTVGHLRTHDMTITQYQRVFGGTTATAPSPRGPRPSNLQPAPRLDPLLVQRTAEELVTNDAFVAQLADEAGELLFGVLFRERLKLSLASLLERRMTMQSQAQATLERVRLELNQPWRIEAGGKDGAPTPTQHLVAMAGEAHHEVTKAEDAIFKTMRLALEEGRQNKEVLANLAGRPAFSGVDAIPVPADLDAGERETIRSLIHMLRQEVNARAEKSRTVVNVTPQEGIAPVDENPGKMANSVRQDFAPTEVVGPYGTVLGTEPAEAEDDGESFDPFSDNLPMR